MTLDCTVCGGPAGKVVVLGLPMRLCVGKAHRGPMLCGFWAGVVKRLPFPIEDAYGFYVMVLPYEGPYLPALWRWLKDWS